MIWRFRISSHQLLIKKGRHLNISLIDRIFPLWKKYIDDEYHFLLYCNSYENNRTAIIIKIKSYKKQCDKMNDLMKIKFLLNNNIVNVLKMSFNFISECLEIKKDCHNSYVLCNTMLYTLTFIACLTYIMCLPSNTNC